MTYLYNRNDPTDRTQFHTPTGPTLSEVKQRNFETLQCGRGLAALAVVCFHANLTLGLPKYFGKEPAHIFSSGFSGIYYFFALSGAVMALAHWDQIGKIQSPWDFYLKRFKRIYLPLWGALLFIIPALATHISAYDVFLALSILPSPHENILAVEWTLRHEILFYLLFGLFLWRPVFGGILLALWFTASLRSIYVQRSFPIDFITSPLHILFLMGMAGAAAIRFEVRLSSTISIAGSLIFLSTWIAQARGAHLSGTELSLAYGAGATFLIVGLARLEVIRALKIPRPLKMLGDASYAIYLVHFPIVALCSKIAASAIKYPNAPLLSLSFLATTSVAVASGLFFHILIERPIMRLSRSMTFLRPEQKS
jgi:peptidoglycan/LPS O-acetylase OafA/YrhL